MAWHARACRRAWGATMSSPDTQSPPGIGRVPAAGAAGSTPQLASLLAQLDRALDVAATLARLAQAEAARPVDSSGGAQLLTAEQVAERLQVPPYAVYEMCRKKKIRTTKIGVQRTQVRISPGDLEAYLAAGRAPLEDEK